MDAQEFYTDEEIRLTALVEEEKKVTLSKPLGVAFITLGILFNVHTHTRDARARVYTFNVFIL